MPLYEYECKHCGRTFEKMVRFSEADILPECPECKSGDTRKKISLVLSFSTGGSVSTASSGGSCGSGGGFT